MIRVLVVEDSPVQRELLIHILSSAPDIEVAGFAAEGEEAVKAAGRLRPDVITMDTHMPGMDGLTATRLIMETNPAPIIIVSASLSQEDVEKSFRAMEAGAVSILMKPRGMSHPDHEREARELIQTVRTMAGVMVVKRHPRRGKTAPVIEPPQPPAEVRVIAIGASTGGPNAIRTILADLPGDLPAPLLVVQHIAEGFLDGFVDWLAGGTNLAIHIAEQGAAALPGHVYVAPDGKQMGIGRDRRIVLSGTGCASGPCPSVSYLFQSVATAYGKGAIGVILTGMGTDGVEGMKLMKEKGAVTIAQDEKSCVIFGMPGEAVKTGAATIVAPLEEIAGVIEGAVRRSIPCKENKGD